MRREAMRHAPSANQPLCWSALFLVSWCTVSCFEVHRNLFRSARFLASWCTSCFGVHQSDLIRSAPQETRSYGRLFQSAPLALEKRSYGAREPSALPSAFASVGMSGPGAADVLVKAEGEAKIHVRAARPRTTNYDKLRCFRPPKNALEQFALSASG
jgi:hypothetical protein